MLRLAVVAVVVSVPRLGIAAPAAECAIFGDDEARETNLARSEEVLKRVGRTPYHLFIGFSATWKEPQEIRYAGLEVVGVVEGDEDTDPAVWIRVTDPELGCEPGPYLVRANDSIGAESSVLAVLPEVVFIEHDGELRFLDVDPDDGEHIISTTWHSPFEIYSGRPYTPPPPTKRQPNRGRRRR